jgi:hypothetical protein
MESGPVNALEVAKKELSQPKVVEVDYQETAPIQEAEPVIKPNTNDFF